MAHVTDLSGELLLQIFSYSKRDLRSLLKFAPVCRLFSRVARTLIFRDVPISASDPHGLHLLERSFAENPDLKALFFFRLFGMDFPSPNQLQTDKGQRQVHGRMGPKYDFVFQFPDHKSRKFPQLKKVGFWE
ncbi:hypothetical protein BDV95DRAFT_603970 [Massariosphaeria phaeospora]|uniref:Uncharacterized protein n=1 Tax=Massariosphaeria phaeospora TaxID=100035 RepID=A0A7C8IB69_9PLEO|nr:hypothetical protein BDV95DRAFT_603970 [Massariosphaeria phaeospora]